MIKKSSLALIIPCYNESGSIPFFQAELVDFLELFKLNFPEYEINIFVVDNNSTDNSLVLLKAIESRHGDMTVLTCSEQGYGAALKAGFIAANADYLSFLDLDNTYPLNNLIDMLKKLKDEDADIVYGARIHKKSNISFVRYLGNRLYVLLLKYLFKSNLSDVCSGMRIFKGHHKNEVLDLKSNDLSFSIDFTSYALVNKWKVIEYAIPYRDRVGDSKLSVVKDGCLFLFIVFRNYVKKNIKNA